MKERYSLIDAIRGLAVVNMVLYHFLFDVYILQGFNVGWRSIPGVHIWQQCICWTFILVSGLSWHLGSHRLRNGLIINGCGLLVTVVTLIAEPDEAIWCGVLTLLGCSLLLATAMKRLLEKIPAIPSCHSRRFGQLRYLPAHPGRPDPLAQLSGGGFVPSAGRTVSDELADDFRIPQSGLLFQRLLPHFSVVLPLSHRAVCGTADPKETN